VLHGDGKEAASSYLDMVAIGLQCVLETFALWTGLSLKLISASTGLRCLDIESHHERAKSRLLILLGLFHFFEAYQLWYRWLVVHPAEVDVAMLTGEL
jgi:hypothetical protein